ncbi:MULTISPECIES: hypothetical protein [unclassified Microcoleus]|jgi:hypothetical protein
MGRNSRSISADSPIETLLLYQIHKISLNIYPLNSPVRGEELELPL